MLLATLVAVAFSSQDEEDADDLLDYGLGLVTGAGAGATSAATSKKKGEKVKRSKRKNHAADPGHMYHLVTLEEWVLSLRGLKTLFTRKKSKGYEPPMKLPVSYVRCLFRGLLEIASGCHAIGCVLGKAGNFKEYFGLDTFLVDETGKVKLSSVSACSPWVRADRDVTGLRAWDKLNSEEKKKVKGRKIGADKLKYASPEILLGSQRITPASDLWAIGVLVLNLAAGKNLFVVNEKEPSASATLYEISKVSRATNVAPSLDYVTVVNPNFLVFASQLAGTISETDKNFGKAKKMPKFKHYEEYMGKLQKKIVAKGGKKKKYKTAFGKGVGMILAGDQSGKQWSEFCGVLDDMMKMDPHARPTAAQMLQHPFFARSDEYQDAKDWLDVRKCLEILPADARPKKRKRNGEEEPKVEEKDDLVEKLLASNDLAMDDEDMDLYSGI